MAVRASINPEILKWARELRNLSIEDLARSLHLREERILHWEQGKSKPTFTQAHELARILNIPFGYLYLSRIPEFSEDIKNYWLEDEEEDIY